jgi:hypothetical protein
METESESALDVKCTSSTVRFCNRG